MGVISA